MGFVDRGMTRWWWGGKWWCGRRTTLNNFEFIAPPYRASKAGSWMTQQQRVQQRHHLAAPTRCADACIREICVSIA